MPKKQDKHYRDDELDDLIGRVVTRGEVVPDAGKDKERIFKFLDKSRMVKYMSDEQKYEFINRLQLRFFKEGNLILREGEAQGEFMFIVESGKVGFLSGITETRDVGQGAIFGEQGMVQRTARSGSVKARTNVLAWTISRADFQAALEASEELREEFARFSTPRDEAIAELLATKEPAAKLPSRVPDDTGSAADSGGRGDGGGSSGSGSGSSGGSGGGGGAGPPNSDGAEGKGAAKNCGNGPKDVPCSIRGRVMTRGDFERSLGLASAAERIHAGITRRRLDTLYTIADTDGNGLLTFAEFARFSLLLSKPEPTFDFAFQLFDLKKDGVVSFDEFLEVMKEPTWRRMLNASADKIEFDFDTTFVRDHFGTERGRKLKFNEFSNFFVELQEEIMRQVFHRHADVYGYVPIETLVYILSNVGGGSIPPGLLRRLQEVSGLSSPSGSGMVHYGEYKAFLRLVDHIPAIIATVKAANRVTRGRGVSIDEFKTAAAATGLNTVSPLEALTLFSLVDTDTDGRIHVEDVVRVLQFPVGAASAPQTPQERAEAQAQAQDLAQVPAGGGGGSGIGGGTGSGSGSGSGRSAAMLALTAVKNFAMGAVAGAIGAAGVFPIDTAKTILQDQRVVAGETPLYRNTLDCLVKVFRAEGIRRLYRGLGPQLLGVAPEKAIKLSVNDMFRSAFSIKDPLTGDDATHISFPLEVLAGGAAGASQVCVTNPLEITKLRLQLQANAGVRKSAFEIVRELGFTGLYKGAGACLLRDVPFSAIYFPAYAAAKEHFAGADGTSSPTELLLAGAIAGMPAASLSTPADVIKTRLQAEVKAGTKAYKGIADCFFRILKEEGPAALMKGAGARVLRSSPQFGITLMAYEVLHKTFTPDAPPRPFTNAPVLEDDLKYGGASKQAKLRYLDEKLSRLR